MAQEMYFIIDGQAAVLTPNEDKLLAVLKNGDYFGELALISGDVSKRMVFKLFIKLKYIYTYIYMFLNINYALYRRM